MNLKPIVAGNPDDCPGAGKCHGCMNWCDFCGDVDAVCQFETCDRHHCVKCRVLLSHAEHDEDYNSDLYKTCANCHRQEEIEQCERDMMSCMHDADNPWLAHDRDNYLRAAETYGWHMKRLMAGG